MSFRFQFRRQVGGGAPRFDAVRQATAGAPIFFKRGGIGHQAGTWLTAWVLMVSVPARAQLQVVPEAITQNFFPGAARRMSVTFYNPDINPVSVRVRMQLYQATSATTAPLGPPRDWKLLEVLPGQSILESAPVALPSVAHATGFLVQWVDETNRVLGTSGITVYPTNLLDALKPLAGHRPMGVFDPQNQLKPLLAASALEFEDLQRLGIRNFSGSLAIIGPFSGQTARPHEFDDAVADLARAGTAVVWIKAESAPGPPLEPAVFTVPAGLGMVAIVRPRVVADLAENPLAQLNLARAAQLAVKPDLLSLNNCEP